MTINGFFATLGMTFFICCPARIFDAPPAGQQSKVKSEKSKDEKFVSKTFRFSPFNFTFAKATSQYPE